MQGEITEMARTQTRLRRGLAVAALAGLTVTMTGGQAALAKKAAKKAPAKKATATTTTVAQAAGRSIPDHPVQGITASEIRVGFALPSSTSTTADYKATYAALIASYRDKGMLPANGRDIKPYYFQIQAGNS